MFLLFIALPPPPRSPLFPYTTLFRSRPRARPDARTVVRGPGPLDGLSHAEGDRDARGGGRRDRGGGSLMYVIIVGAGKDRKSTRLNSSHRCISYAVFCLKKKKNKMED